VEGLFILRLAEIGMSKRSRKGWLINLGRVDYDDGLALQAEFERKRKEGEVPDLFILLEHEPVYTMGRSTDPDNLLLDRDDLEKRGIKVREIRRGGDITFHGPGQLVGYPIIDLQDHKKDAHWYLRSLEKVLINACDHYGVKCYTIEGMTGVWCDGGKIAAIGVGISKWVTTHGFAMNVNTDLGFFGGIIPCGINNKPVTSLQAQLGKKLDMPEVRAVTANAFSAVFDIQLETKDLLA
jgi:lipoate-protein ligase B